MSTDKALALGQVPATAQTLQRVTAEHVSELRRRLGDDTVRTDAAALDQHGRDATEAFCFPPAAVVLPSSTEQVAEVLRYASEQRLAITPRGAGTGLSGGALPVHGGLALGLERMNRIRHIDHRNLTAEVETGVITAEFQRQVEAQGLYYPPDPGSRETCQLGGNLGEDAAGPHSCKYGTTRRFVLGLEAVLADGSIIHTGGANRKDTTGYNLTQLLVGSEGTLAVLTAATLRLLALPKARLLLVVPFGDLAEAAAAVEAIFRQGFDPATCELLESGALSSVGDVMQLPDSLVGQEAVLLLELDGDDADALLQQAAALGELVEGFGAGEILAAEDAADQRRLWQVRAKVGEAIAARSVFKEADTVAPRHRLVELVTAARDVAARHGLTAYCFGHVGDGNLHVTMLRGDLADAEWHARRDAAEAELFAAVVALGGKIAGEHGIGWTQRRYLGLALEPAQIALMQRLKHAFDPLGILNPGKIFADAAGDATA